MLYMSDYRTPTPGRVSPKEPVLKGVLANWPLHQNAGKNKLMELVFTLNQQIESEKQFKIIIWFLSKSFLITVVQKKMRVLVLF